MTHDHDSQGQAAEKVTLSIGGMTCAACVHHVEGALAGVDGVSGATVNLATERATVEYVPSIASVADFREVGDRRRVLAARRRGGRRRPAHSRRPRRTEVEGRAQSRDRGRHHGGHGCGAPQGRPAVRRGPAVHGAGHPGPVLGRRAVLRGRVARSAGPHEQHEHADSGGHVRGLRLQRLRNPVRRPGRPWGGRLRDLLRHVHRHHRLRAAGPLPGGPREGQGVGCAQGSGGPGREDGAGRQGRRRVRRACRGRGRG